MSTRVEEIAFYALLLVGGSTCFAAGFVFAFAAGFLTNGVA